MVDLTELKNLVVEVEELLCVVYIGVVICSGGAEFLKTDISSSNSVFFEGIDVGRTARALFLTIRGLAL